MKHHPIKLRETREHTDLLKPLEAKAGRGLTGTVWTRTFEASGKDGKPIL